jgi:hypothetical protein
MQVKGVECARFNAYHMKLIKPLGVQSYTIHMHMSNYKSALTWCYETGVAILHRHVLDDVVIC